MLTGVLAACTQDAPAVEEPEVTEAPAVEAEATEEPEEDKPVDANSLPREETLYYAGQQWGPVNGWNPLSNDMNNALCLTQSSGGSRTLMFETLYMYNMLDGSLTPLLADGDYVWNDDKTEMTVKLNQDAMWSDGTPVTAADVAYSFEANVRAGNSQAGLADFIESVTAVDDYTVLVKSAVTEDGVPKNPLNVISYLVQSFIMQKDWLETN